MLGWDLGRFDGCQFIPGQLGRAQDSALDLFG